MEARLQVATALLRGLRNKLLPIHRLPPEVLTNIFTMTQRVPPSFCPWEAELEGLDSAKRPYWLSLLTVCRHWRGIIATSAHMWSCVDNRFDPEIFLKRSRSALLNVHLISLPHDPPAPPTMLQILGKHIQRFAQLHITAENEPLIFPLLMSKPAPQLFSLSINNAYSAAVPWHMTTDVLPPIFQGKMPLLKQLSLKGFSSWPTGYFHGLTHLYLHGQSDASRPTTSGFLDFLEHSPELEILTLSNAGPTRDNISDTPSAAVTRFLPLPRLKVLNFESWKPFAISRLLSHFDISQDCELYIIGWSNTALLSSQETLGSILPPELSRLKNLRNLQECRISLISGWSSLFDHIAVVGNVLHFCGRFSFSQLIPMTVQYPVQQIRRLRIHDSRSLNNHLISHDPWKEILAGFPALRHLEIDVGPRTQGLTKDIIIGLDSQNGSSMICPRLKTVQIENEKVLPGLRIQSLAETRATHGAPLRRLRVYSSERVPEDNISVVFQQNEPQVTDDDAKVLKKHIRAVVFRDDHPRADIISRSFGSAYFKCLRMFDS
ncbi:hypothetical protein C8J56DRAFT_973165 [Mycena floridula]|nr:hypothetical protein C8J56DRAFT_973165 [Mycena floridula]